MKLAYFSPLNPQPSGISDYSEELLPYLAAGADITLFVDGFEPANPEIKAKFPFKDYRRDPSVLQSLNTYDVIVYHMGNDHRYHAGILEVACRYPGIVVFHDFALQDFFLGLARESGDMSLYLDELAACHGEDRRREAQESLVNGLQPQALAQPTDFPLNCRLAQAAEGIVVHSEWGRRRFEEMVPGTPQALVQMPVKPLDLSLRWRHAWTQMDPRRRTIQLASFGLIIPGKGIEQTLRALATVRDEFDFHYTLVGAENPYFDTPALIDHYGMTGHVTITGAVSLAEFERRIAETDIAINLRERTVGETSASLCRIMAAGVPAIVSDAGWFAELPDDCVARIKLDGDVGSKLQECLRTLLGNAGLRRRLGANSRRYILAEHDISRSAAHYLSFVREVIGRRKVKSINKVGNALTPTAKVANTVASDKLPSAHAPTSSASTSACSNSTQGQSAALDATGIRDQDRRLKLAYFSPLNPQASGISDYSEELLPHLATHADIDLFVDGFRPNNPRITTHFRFFDYRRDPAVLARLNEYDAAIYHVGNDHRYHTGIVDALRRHPGIAVFHDFALQDFFLGVARNRGDMDLYFDELGSCHGERERALAEQLFQRGGVLPHVAQPLDFPLNCRLARASTGIVVHSEWSRERFRQIAPSTPSARINHHVTNLVAPKLWANQVFGESAIVQVASFGLITPDKGIERALRALAALRGEFRFHYKLIGPSGNFPELPELIQRYGMSNHVTVTGQLSLADFERQIAQADIAINLRERPVGATSGSLCRIMAAGVPAIVSNVGAFAELPDATVIKVDNDQHGDAVLVAYLRRLLSDTALRQRIGANARRHMLAEHRIEESAAGYVNFISEVINGRVRRKVRDDVASQLSQLSVPASNRLLRGVAAEVATLIPQADFKRSTPYSSLARLPHHPRPDLDQGSNGHSTPPAQSSDSPGRLPKIAGVDYKRAALEYPSMLDAERSHYLRTKPFYNLANKPEKHLGDGMDSETHRHFTDFANMASVLALPAGAKILDVGCGSGWLSEYFARLGYDVTGIDISDELIAMARERVARVPYDVDHETPLRCRFLTQDIEAAALPEKFDAVICYDSLHHFEDERAVFRHLAQMLDAGGLLFILEGHKPTAGSATEAELQDVMRRYGTLESPFSSEYLSELISDNGCVIVGDYVSVNGLFERQMLEDNRLPLRSIATDYHYLTCIKVTEGGPATTVPDSRRPGLLRAEFQPVGPLPKLVAAKARISIPVIITNNGDTLWLSGQTVRAGVVMPGVRVLRGAEIISEAHGHPLLPRSVAPGQSLALDIQCTAPGEPGAYTVRIDLVDQHVCWFEERGSQPLVFTIKVEESN